MKEAMRIADRAMQKLGTQLVVWSTGLPRDVVEAHLARFDREREERRNLIIESGQELQQQPLNESREERRNRIIEHARELQREEPPEGKTQE